MMINFNKLSIETLYREQKYKQIADLFLFVVDIEKIVNKPIINKIFIANDVLLSLNALVWNRKNPQSYKKMSSVLKINAEDLKNIKIKTIQNYLINNIYEQVIKNEIMMI